MDKYLARYLFICMGVDIYICMHKYLADQIFIHVYIFVWINIWLDIYSCYMDKYLVRHMFRVYM